MTLPRAKKPLVFQSDGNITEDAWQKSLLEFGPAARVGDEVQITRVLIEEKKIVLEINGGLKSGRHWYDHVQVGMGGSWDRSTTPKRAPAGGSNLALVFPESVPSLTVTTSSRCFPVV